MPVRIMGSQGMVFSPVLALGLEMKRETHASSTGWKTRKAFTSQLLPAVIGLGLTAGDLLAVAQRFHPIIGAALKRRL